MKSGMNIGLAPGPNNLILQLYQQSIIAKAQISFWIEQRFDHEFLSSKFVYFKNTL